MPPIQVNRIIKLPPLILHPFAEPESPAKLVQASRAGLILQGYLPPAELKEVELKRQVKDGRYCEISMLFYVGKDLLRWADQCTEFVESNSELRNAGICSESFITMLIEDTPPNVDRKLRDWGVFEHRRIFSRAIGLHAIFETLPEPELLTDGFIRNYYYYADQLFAARQKLKGFTILHSPDFSVEIYASGEYSRMLEREWEDSPAE